jgi:putative CocE/NonD family hydrolase
MGANEWRDEDDWPLARAVETRFYLRADGALTREPPAEEAPDEFAYDPSDPVPTVGGNTLLPGSGFFMGPRDRRAVHKRPDVLLYVSDVLQRDIEVTGPLSAILHISTSALDTDFTVALLDIYPDGRAVGIADGILRLRYRNSFDRQELATPGHVYAIEVDLVATSNVFLAGHCIGVEVSSSNFPRFDRNPNSGGVVAKAIEADFVVAQQRVFHDANRASYVVLPVIPRS